MPNKLSVYHAKRNFSVTPEPKGETTAPDEHLRFVVQKHDARNLHYDFRLEIDGTLKSWAVPKGPSLDPAEKRLAVHVEDHPLDYMHFEGDIPEHQYGAGHVDVWDTGYWEPQGDPSAAYESGKLKFHLDGEKLQGGWALVKTRLPGSGGKEQWLLIKEKDEYARPHKEFDITEEMPDSVLSKKPRKAAKSAAKVKAPAKARSPKKTTRDSFDPAGVEGAKKAPLPEALTPQLATLVDTIPETGNWLYELKFDGYRLVARIDKGRVTLLTRDNNDWTDRLPAQAAAIESLGLKNGWLDGEIVMLDKHGAPSFQLLQNAFRDKSTESIKFFLFDLPHLNGYDLRKAPLIERRELLGRLLEDVADPLRFSPSLNEPPRKLLDSACAMAMEGIIGKRGESPYTEKRSPDWIKLKCRQRQEFVIGGYTEPQGSRQFFGALLLGVYDDDGKLHYAGKVGTGFDSKLLSSIYKQMKSLEKDKLPFAEKPGGIRLAQTHGLKPQLVAEISFAEWTADGLLRQAVFHGIRLDKPASEIRREKAVHAPDNGKKQTAKSNLNDVKSDTIHGVKITHPDRVIDPESGLTKLDLAHYYAQVAPHILPFLKNRPVYLLRAPEGITGERFFQKH
ncbi:MAG: bifunctional non-ous end joining protein LigD, partial [Burkholderiales bacterium]